MGTGGGSARSAEKGCRPPPLAAVCFSARLSVREAPQARQLRLSADATARFPAERSMSRPDVCFTSTPPEVGGCWAGGRIWLG